VLRGVCQRLGDCVVGGGLDRLGQTLGQIDVELDRERRTCAQHLERRPEAALGEHCRMDPARELT
jgi:hypothetical protein